MLLNTEKYGKLFLHKIFYQNKQSISGLVGDKKNKYVKLIWISGYKNVSLIWL